MCLIDTCCFNLLTATSTPHTISASSTRQQGHNNTSKSQQSTDVQSTRPVRINTKSLHHLTHTQLSRFKRPYFILPTRVSDRSARTVKLTQCSKSGYPNTHPLPLALALALALPLPPCLSPSLHTFFPPLDQNHNLQLARRLFRTLTNKLTLRHAFTHHTPN